MKHKKRLLIVDDEPNIRKILQAAFERVGYVVETAASGDDAVALLTTDTFDLVMSDVLMPGISGVELLKKAKALHPNMPFIVMTAYGTITQAVEAMREGATDYITKPFDLDVVKKAVAYWTPNTKPPTPSPTHNSDMIAESEQMKEVVALVEKIADSRATVLLTGESGTGKEVVAKAIHRRGSRNSHAFVAVNCAALPETLLESELFGHEKGAYTGADTARAGRFELANEGTLFLDEIGDVPPAIQVKLLRVLQEREIERLGATKATPVDVRLIAATNKDLQAAVAVGLFREDLFFRLQVVTIELAPLRERKPDILPLAQLFVTKYAQANGSTVTEIREDAANCLISYRWPGNVRELENVIERAVVLAPRGANVVTPDMLPRQLLSAA